MQALVGKSLCRDVAFGRYGRHTRIDMTLQHLYHTRARASRFPQGARDMVHFFARHDIILSRHQDNGHRTSYQGQTPQAHRHDRQSIRAIVGMRRQLCTAFIAPDYCS